MPERVTVYTLDHKPRVITRVKTALLETGDSEDKFLVSTNRGAYIQRRLVPHVVENLIAMERVGIPVPKGVLLNPEGNYMLVPDLKADGSELYGKSLRLSFMSQHYHRHRPRPEIDEIFLDLTSPKNMPTLERSAKRIFTLADKNGIEMPNDDPLELRVRPNRNRQFVCVDVDHAFTDPADSEAVKDSRRERNADSLDSVMNDLVAIRYHLLNP